ncbi:MAG: type I-B CRISPR-associated protein Cas8b1/Cst1 [Fusobacterium sp.]
MSEIVIELGTWQYNAGIAGLCNILEKNGIEINIHEDKLIFNSEEELKKALENFEEKYFNYLIEKYEKTLSWYKIVSYKEELQDIKNNFEILDEKKFQELDKYIKEILKYYIKSASYKAAYELIDGNIDPLQLEKELKPVSIKKNEKISDKKEDILKMIDKALVLIEYCEKGKEYLAGKNVIYTLIKNAWNGVCFLNPQTKEKNFYKDFKNYFVDTALSYLDEDKSKYKYECFVCDNKIKNFDNDFSFLNETGFDTARKPSHAWNFLNNAGMCPLCRLIYSCIPAGFSYVYGNGIFINSNQSLTELLRVNRLVYEKIYNHNTKNEGNSSLTYRALAEALKDEKEENLKYELADIQMVRYENEKYYFNILSKNIIKIIKNSKNDLDFLTKAWYREINTDFRIYEEVMKRLLNNENLFTLIYKLLFYKVSREKDCHFTANHVMNILNINYRILEGVGLMENREKFNREAKAAGFYLREKYINKKAEHKIPGLCYRILNGIKTNNRNMVMDTIFNMYLYVESPVSNVIAKMLDDDKSLEQFGYGFTAGFLSGKQNENSKADGGEE